ncbi:hypothetical protein [Phenylobacterium sp.]|uniref:hypothetical protein n=1 Tax=Phenylobacterium sp. TaxID=1871053 RepID=UPI0025FE312D|nr:hypothetical protein [Phenylobacterium sp.]
MAKAMADGAAAVCPDGRSLMVDGGDDVVRRAPLVGRRQATSPPPKDCRCAASSWRPEP